MQKKIIETGDGSKTLFVPHINEHYHSINGAITESNYVYIEKGFKHNQASQPHVLEIGFGTGLNALLTALEAERSKRKTCYITIEKYPLEADEVQKLDYGKQISEHAIELYKQLHLCKWNQYTSLSPYFDLLKTESDVLTYSFDIPSTDIIYFDAFGPDKQPEMWLEEIFRRLNQISKPNSTLVTYSAKGEIRRRLERSGYCTERLPGPPGKRQMLRATKL